MSQTDVDQNSKPTALVFGGGLAGMTVAKQLACHGFQVELYESTDRLGGKAGVYECNGKITEHGYHFFPAWYCNTLPLLEDLKIRRHCFDRWYYLDERRKNRTFSEQLHAIVIPRWHDLRTALQTLRASPAPAPDSLLYLYFLLDTVGEKMLRERKEEPTNRHMELRRFGLDRVSRIGLLRNKWYATHEMAELEVHCTLKASAIPAHEMSAFTVKVLTDYWLANRDPIVSILQDDLYTAFIVPFENQLREMGVMIRKGVKVVGLNDLDDTIDPPAVKSARVRHRNGMTCDCPADVFVVTTPLEVTRTLFGPRLYNADPGLGRVQHLESEPMASLHLWLNRKLNDLPREHVIFLRGLYGLSFIDVSQNWPEDAARKTQTELSFIATDFAPIQELSGLHGAALKTAQFEALMSEISRYLEITIDDVAEYRLNPNVSTPLFINTVGAWSNRLSPVCDIDNLFFAGDWVRNHADLCCMESAVSSALDAAHAICERFESRPGVRVPTGSQRPKQFGETKARLITFLLTPLAFLVYVWARLSDGRPPQRDLLPRRGRPRRLRDQQPKG